MRVLLIEDNQALSDMLSAHLREQGFTVQAVQTGAGALEATAYDAVILDLGLPDIDGMDVLRRMRQRATLPTLILTARDGVANRVAGLNAGADDYILKPFDLDEFDARLRAVLRRPGAREAPFAQCGDLRFDSAGRDLHCAGRSVELTNREAVLLEELLRHGERIAVRDTLLERLYADDADISLNALEAIVSRLRRKLAQLGSTVSIDTVRGIGYRVRQEAAPP